jgi:hypothetical protein
LPIDQVLVPEHFDSRLLRERLMLILHCKDITQWIFFPGTCEAKDQEVLNALSSGQVDESPTMWK